MTARRLLLVDLSNQVYKACHVHDMLSVDDGTGERLFTGGLYGFLNSVAKAINTTEATDIVVCRDTKPYLRSATYPEYKLLRTKAQDADLKANVDASIPLVDLVCREIGLPLWWHPGMECDDLIGAAARRERHRYELIIAMSGDSDLFQLFDVPNFRMYADSKKPLIDPEEFGKRWNWITPEQYITAAALMGTHNDIAGIAGVGPVTAVKIVKDAVQLRRYRGDHGELIDRNVGLIRLPHPTMPPNFRIPRARGDFDRYQLYRACGRYDINVLPSWTAAFEQVLGD